MNRTNKILIGLFVLQLGAVALTWSTKKVVVPDQKALLPFATEDILEFTIEKQSYDKRAGDAKVVLKRDTNGDWLVAGAGNFRAVKSKVDDVLERLATAKIRRPIAKKKENHNALNVGDLSYTKRLELKTKANTYVLYAGSAKGSSMHARFNNQDEVYLAKGISAWRISNQLSNYIDTLYVELTDPSELRLRNQAGRLDIQKDQNGQWVVAQLPPDKALDDVRLKGLLDAARKIHLAIPVGTEVKPAYRLGKNSRAHVTVSNGGQTITYDVGAEVGGHVFLKAKDKAFVVKVRKFSMESILTTQANDLIDVTKMAKGAPSTGWAADDPNNPMNRGKPGMPRPGRPGSPPKMPPGMMPPPPSQGR